MLLRSVFLIFFGFSILGPAASQQVLMSEDLRGDTITPDAGMNRKHFHHAFIGSNMFLGAAAGPLGEIKTLSSAGIEYGYRYKRKISHHYSGGYELAFRRLNYFPKDWQMASLNGDEPLRRERMVLLQTGLGLYQRINWQKRRGDFIGRFFDLGVYANWTFASRHVYTFKQPAGEQVKVKKSRLDYVQPFDYGVLGRIGFGNFVLKTTYRFSNHFKEDSGLEEFPRLTLGFELGLHPY